MSAGAAAAAMAARRAAQAENEQKANRQKMYQENAIRLRAELENVKGKPDMMMLIRVAKAERLASGEIQEAEPPPNYRIGLERETPADEVIGNSGKLYGYVALCCLHVYDQPRKAAIYIVESKPFDPIILITIMCNCATMAWESPLDPTGTWKEQFINVRCRGCCRCRRRRRRLRRRRRRRCCWQPRRPRRPARRRRRSRQAAAASP